MKKVVLAYLISASPSASDEANAHERPTRILFGSRVSKAGDEEHLEEVSEILLYLEKERTFDVLHQHLPFTWMKGAKYDIVNPFGDSRPHYHALWTFNTVNDMLSYTNNNRRSQMPLGLIRERAVSLDDMELLGGPIPVPLQHSLDVRTSYWKPNVDVDDRIRTFTHQLLRDFYYQWRHILRNDYNSVTLRVLSRAIIRLSTLDFHVLENMGGQYVQGAHVWITQLPAWKPFKADIVRIGTVWVVLCHDILKGLSIAQQHAESRETSTGRCASTPESPSATVAREERPHYMILSVKHIMLCHAINTTTLKHTAPEPLFNGDYGIRNPSDLALDYLTWATASARPPIITPIQCLPIEIQDMILGYSSLGTVSAAKLGCMLGLGSQVLWKHGPLKIAFEELALYRPLESSVVESQIRFGEHDSGLFYLPRKP